MIFSNFQKFLGFVVSVLLSTSVERCFVSRMRDFFYCSIFFAIFHVFQKCFGSQNNQQTQVKPGTALQTHLWLSFSLLSQPLPWTFTATHSLYRKNNKLKIIKRNVEKVLKILNPKWFKITGYNIFYGSSGFCKWCSWRGKGLLLTWLRQLIFN